MKKLNCIYYKMKLKCKMQTSQRHVKIKIKIKGQSQIQIQRIQHMFTDHFRTSPMFYVWNVLQPTSLLKEIFHAWTSNESENKHKLSMKVSRLQMYGGRIYIHHTEMRCDDGPLDICVIYWKWKEEIAPFLSQAHPYISIYTYSKIYKSMLMR